MFKKVLIANRGEIAVRIARTLQEMRITAVGVYSEADRTACHVSACDEAYPLSGVTAQETYLRSDRLIEIARSHGVEAIHPGYGFLSERADFAEACQNAGLTFIGPSPEVIRAMGDKIIAKETVAAAGVPVVPGWSSTDYCFSEIQYQADKLGYPVLIKAAAGGGGKGMRVVQDANHLAEALESAQREAGAAFGDGRVFLEKYLQRPRHVEVQIFGDHHGQVIHLFERECSIQRRHQKIIEESPSPALTPELRRRLCAAAVTAAQAIQYASAGTVEFILDEAGQFYFLEVNTRLQVEHPVTEMITGLDLVYAQMKVAAGEPFPLKQEELLQRGHALECRICSEDANDNFRPQTGQIEVYVSPQGGGVRVDSGVNIGSEVSVHYDPMLAKLIVHAPTRLAAIDKAIQALRQFVILGVRTNIPFLAQVLDHPEFRAGQVHTHFLQEQHWPVDDPENIPDAALLAAALAVKPVSRFSSSTAWSEQHDTGPWAAAGPWRGL
ncbi:MAG: Acetyl-/propionyl-coenzyme A carboxylase alpha chain [Phycisphaerae bacterium]|nr:Acetyl-/propionyl-coenzyme A carboxylase alpha chain [Phycisphaerae bacterium]